MARFILDTDTSLYWLRGDRRIEKKILTTGLQNVFITIIAACELFQTSNTSHFEGIPGLRLENWK